jgi:hypothetical protein
MHHFDAEARAFPISKKKIIICRLMEYDDHRGKRLKKNNDELLLLCSPITGCGAKSYSRFI